MDSICCTCVSCDDCRVNPDNMEDCKPYDYSYYEEDMKYMYDEITGTYIKRQVN